MSKAQKTSPQSPDRDPLGVFEHGVIALFEGPLASVGFPGVDKSTLADAARSTIAAQLVVEAAERDLEHARRELAERRAELEKMAKRAVAYARVLAEDDGALGEQLDALAPRVTEPARVARKRRARTEEPMLPTMTTEDEATETDDAEMAAE